MKKMPWMMFGLILCGTMSMTSAAADGIFNEKLNRRVEQLEARLKMEGDVKRPAGWTDRFSVSGVIEVEAGYTSVNPVAGDRTENSDIAIATVEVGIGADIADHVSADILLLYEDGEPIVVDEAFITIDGEQVVPLYLRAGEMYIPFGKFDAHMISDPLTLEIAETREAALQVGAGTGGLYGSAFVFNGDMNEIDTADDPIDNFGANAGFEMEGDALRLDVGASYINNLVDADAWGDVAEDENLALRDFVGGIGAYAVIGVGPITLTGEYVTALDDLVWVDETDNLIDEGKIAAWNAEVGFGFAIAEKAATVAFGYQGTDSARNRLPEKRYLGSFGVSIFENTTLALEYRMDDYENDDEAKALMARLAIEF